MCMAVRRAFYGLLLLGVTGLGACTYEQEGPPKLHFRHFNTAEPVEDTVTVCSAYGCQRQTPFTFTDADIRHLATLMAEQRVNNTPQAERNAIGAAIAWIERRVGAATGTDRDRPGLDLLGSGDRRQQDCVDEATNTTSYLMVMERYALLRHHRVVRPMAKGNMIMGTWVHWGAMIEEKESGRKYAVDSFFRANGEPPLIMAAERWYIDEGETPAPIRSRTASANASEGGVSTVTKTERLRLNKLLDRVIGPPAGPRASAFGATR